MGASGIAISLFDDCGCVRSIMNHAVAAQSKFHALDPHRSIDWMLFCVVLSFETYRGAFCCLIIFLRHPFAFMRVKVAFA